MHLDFFFKNYLTEPIGTIKDFDVYAYCKVMRLKVTWIVEGEVAGSPMPVSREDLRLIWNMGIRAIVVLVKNYELAFYWPSSRDYMSELNRIGFRVLHSPIPDFSAPDLGQCLEILQWVSKQVRANYPVLFHCRGGIGRTGTMLACYLVFRYGLAPGDAIMAVRRKIRNALMVDEQVQLVYELSNYLDSCENRLNRGER